MKTWISVFCSICICLFASSTGKAQSNIARADSLFAGGKFQEAGLAYAYAEYRAGSTDTLVIARLGQVKCFQQNEQYTEACRVIDQTTIFGIPDGLAATVIYQSLLSHYLAGQPDISISRYQQARQRMENSQYRRHALLILSLCYLDTQNWPMAEQTGHLLVQPAVSREWEAFFGKEALPRFRNPETARWISTFLPGMGQVYAGKTGSGVLNFTIHAGILTLATLGFINGYYVTAWLAGLGMFQKFYYGGIRRAEELCKIKNRQELEKYLLPVKTFLINQAESVNSSGSST